MFPLKAEIRISQSLPAPGRWYATATTRRKMRPALREKSWRPSWLRSSCSAPGFGWLRADGLPIGLSDAFLLTRIRDQLPLIATGFGKFVVFRMRGIEHCGHRRRVNVIRHSPGSSIGVHQGMIRGPGEILFDAATGKRQSWTELFAGKNHRTGPFRQQFRIERRGDHESTNFFLNEFLA